MLLGGYPPFGRSILGLSHSDLPFMNLLKGTANWSSSPAGWQSQLNADGYPTAIPSNDINGGCSLPSNYYGRYVVSFSGTGSVVLAGPGFIVYSGSGFVQVGNLAFGLYIVGQTNPTVEFALGTLVSGAANNGSGLIRLTVGSTINIQNGQLYTVQGVTGTTEANGLWAVTVVDGTHFDLQGSVFSNAYVSGGEAIAQSGGLGVIFKAQGPYSGMSNAVLCRKADSDGSNAFGLQAGYRVNADLVARLQQLRPYAVRFLNLMGVINSLASDYTRRPALSTFTYNNDLVQFVPSYWTTITRGGSDAYTCANPGASGSGAYVDGEVVQGVVDNTNLTMTPTLNVGGRGAKPIFGNNAATVAVVGGTIASGHTINLIFTGSYIPGSPYHLVYTTVAGDAGNASTLASHLYSAINADATLQAANISADVAYQYIQIIYNRNAGSGTTFSYTSTGAETISFGSCIADGGTNGIPANTTCTFVYNVVLGGWIFETGGLRSGFAVPPEVICELCNRAKVNAWFEIPLLYSSASISALASTIAANLDQSLSVMVEVSNEIWNFAQASTSAARNLGACLGFSFQGGVGQFESFYGLRVRQFQAVFATAWIAAGRSRGSLKMVMAHSLGAEDLSVNGALQRYRFNGIELTASNTTYAALGGLGGTSGTTYTAVGQRPIDVCDSVSYAAYFAGVILVNLASQNWPSSMVTCSPILQAGLDYATGGQANINSAMNSFDADVRTGASGLLPYYQNAETLYASYDGVRPSFGMAKLEVNCYEGGFEGNTGGNFSDATTTTALVQQFVNYGWNTSAYGATNTVVAQQVVNAYFAYKKTTQFLLTIKYFLGNPLTVHANRTARSAWFQFSGPNIWAMYPGDPYTTAYTSANAFGLFNA